MRINHSVILTLLCLFLIGGSWSEIQAARRGDQIISGAIVHDHGTFDCKACETKVELVGSRPVMTTFADSNGSFMFIGVRPGFYTIRVTIDGIPEAEHTIDIYDGLSTSTINISISRRSRPEPQPRSSVVDVSEFLSAYPKRAVERFKRAAESRKRAKNDEAIKYLEEAVKIAPNFYQAHNDLGLLYKDKGRFEDAERAFLKAHETNKSGADPLINLSSLYIDEDKPQDAITTAEKAVKVNERSAPAFFNLGVALYKISMLDRAESALKKALSLAPKMFQVRLMLANVYAKLRRYDNLMEQLDGYLAENPDGTQRKQVEEMKQKLLQSKQQLQ